MKLPNTPSFLHDVEIDSGDVKTLRAHLSNWMLCHQYISKLEPTPESVEILKRMMVVEYLREQGARMDILVRLHGRFQRLRYEVERVELRA